MLQLGSLPSERDCLHRVAGTLTHSMSREGMECGLRFRVLELVAGIYRLQVSSTVWKGGRHGCWLFSSHGLLNKGQHGGSKEGASARVSA